MIIFKSLMVEGFGSILDPFTLIFGNKGLILIKGDNGYGKTTIFSALYWVLYGKTLKDKSTVTTWEHLRPDGFKGTKVKLVFERAGKELHIIRCQDYKGEIIRGVKGANRLIITDGDGDELYPAKSKPELQSKVSQLIGLSQELFKFSIVFGQKMKRLVEEDGPTKKKLFEEAFGVDYINIAKDNAYKKYKAAEAELIPLERELFGIESTIESQLSHIASVEQKMQDFEMDQERKVQVLQDKAKVLKKELKGLMEYEKIYYTEKERLAIAKDTLDKVRKKFDMKAFQRLSSQLAKDSLTVGNYKKDIKKNELALEKANETDLCPTCGGKFKKGGHEEHIAKIQMEITQFSNALIEVEKAMQTHNREFASQSKLHKSIESKEDEIRKLERLIKEIPYSEIEVAEKTNSLAAIKIRIKEEQEAVINFGVEDLISELSRLQKESKAKGKEIRRVRKRYDIQEWLYTKVFSNSGLKAFIFNQMLNRLNVILERNSKQFGIRPYFMVDMESARKDIVSFAYMDGVPVSFADLSGGQGQLANIITAFATHELVAKDKFNIMVLDEVFEGLSKGNIEIVSELINNRVMEQQIFLITHRAEFSPTGARTLEFELQDGVTRPLF